MKVSINVKRRAFTFDTIGGSNSLTVVVQLPLVLLNDETFHVEGYSIPMPQVEFMYVRKFCVWFVLFDISVVFVAVLLFIIEDVLGEGIISLKEPIVSAD